MMFVVLVLGQVFYFKLNWGRNTMQRETASLIIQHYISSALSPEIRITRLASSSIGRIDLPARFMVTSQ